MKVLLTGGAGYIGSVTTQQLLNLGHSVTVFDNLERGHRSAVDDRATFVQGDLRDAERINEVMASERPDAVMHFAAYALVPESMQNPEMYFRNNVVGGTNLTSAMIKNGVNKIVFSSTCATYGIPEKGLINEETKQLPTNPYGESKLMLEKILGWYRELNGLQSVFLRYFNACGATEKFGEDHDPETHIIPIVLQVALGKRDKVFIYGDDYNTPDGSCVRDYIHIVDLAQAHIIALTGDYSGPFNLGNGEGYSVKDVINVAREVTGCDIPSEIGPRRAGDPDSLVACADKAKNVLHWKPEYPELKAIIESAWNWHKSNPEGYKD